jgi:hypothetical protein
VRRAFFALVLPVSLAFGLIYLHTMGHISEAVAWFITVGSVVVVVVVVTLVRELRDR